MTTEIENDIAAGESIAEILVARAEALGSHLKARAAAADELRRLPDENVTELRKAGLFRLLEPRNYGGLQTNLHTFINVVAAVGRSCGSSAWCLGVMNVHHWLAAVAAPQLQEDIYANKEKPGVLISGVLSPRGQAKRNHEGYRLSGFWPFCSGVYHAEWIILGARISDESGSFLEEGVFFVPQPEVIVKDDWNVGGLRGTGSSGIAAEELFVASHRFLSVSDILAGTYPGAFLHQGNLYQSAAMPVLTIALTPAALGLAESALEAFRERLPGREVAFTNHEMQIEMPVTHMQVAEAAAKISCARLLLHRSAADIEEAAASGLEMPLAARARVRMDSAMAVRLCLEAIEILYLACGGSGIACSNPIQRLHDDIHAVNMHGLLCRETALEMYGRILLGLSKNTPLI
jgi:3-hydroxy-9,10-secoandrosta-1,3,5(10)-triene-9,17-dione monooxygenase